MKPTYIKPCIINNEKLNVNEAVASCVVEPEKHYQLYNSRTGDGVDAAGFIYILNNNYYKDWRDPVDAPYGSLEEFLNDNSEGAQSVVWCYVYNITYDYWSTDSSHHTGNFWYEDWNANHVIDDYIHNGNDDVLTVTDETDIPDDLYAIMDQFNPNINTVVS